MPRGHERISFVFSGAFQNIFSQSQTKCAHAPWASYNTPQIELIQYGRRIGKEVYSE